MQGFAFIDCRGLRPRNDKSSVTALRPVIAKPEGLWQSMPVLSLRSPQGCGNPGARIHGLLPATLLRASRLKAAFAITTMSLCRPYLSRLTLQYLNGYGTVGASF